VARFQRFVFWMLLFPLLWAGSRKILAAAVIIAGLWIAEEPEG
jgi:hypothetical protein